MWRNAAWFDVRAVRTCALNTASQSSWVTSSAAMVPPAGVARLARTSMPPSAATARSTPSVASPFAATATGATEAPAAVNAATAGAPSGPSASTTAMRFPSSVAMSEQSPS